ncbi:MAG: 50S ribosomal protein L4 [Balneolaceae bacterium]|nr:50S ribosomal protein L4 [Balneolaceae bacterium]
MKLEVYSIDGKKNGKSVELDATVFGIKPNRTVMFEDVRRIQANKRQGTAKTKERGEIRGSTKKLFKQKGTGNARRGDIKSPLLRGGGTSHGPRPRPYNFSMTKKAIQLARRSALSLKVAQEGVMVVENFDFETPRTKDMAVALTNLGLEGKKILVLTPGKVDSIYKSGRNLPGVRVLESNKPTTLDIMHAEVLVFLEGGLEELQSNLAVDAKVQKAREDRVSEAQAKLEAAAKAKLDKKIAGSKKSAAKNTATKTSAAKKPATTKASASTATASKSAESKPTTQKKATAAKKTTAKTTTAKSTTAKKTTTAKSTTAKSTAKSTTKESTTKKAEAKKASTAKSTTEKGSATKSTAKKATSTKKTSSTTAKATSAKSTASKTTAKKSTKKDSGEDKS